VCVRARALACVNAYVLARSLSLSLSLFHTHTHTESCEEVEAALEAAALPLKHMLMLALHL
jgi:hypothetical protein